MPKGRFAYIFPNKSSALIQVRFRSDLSESERDRAIGLVRRAVAMPEWKLPNGKGTYVVTGAPVVVCDLTRSISHSLIALLVAALVVMAVDAGPGLPRAAAAAAARRRAGRRRADLRRALAGRRLADHGLDRGAARAHRARRRLRDPAAGARPGGPGRGGRDRGGGASARRMRGAPTVATAAAATAAGFLVLALSPVPMVRGFGLLLVAGIALALGCALTLGVAALAGVGEARTPAAVARGARAGVARRRRADRGQPRGARGAPPRRRGRARRAAPGHRPPGPRRPRRARLRPRRLGPRDADAGGVRPDQARAPERGDPRPPGAAEARPTWAARSTSSSRAQRVTDPAVVKWMTSYQAAVLKRFGYSAKRGCGKAELCPAFSLPDLFQGGQNTTRQQIEGLLDAVPAYFSQGVITRRPAHGDDGLRHPPHAARPPGAGHRRHARSPAPAGGDRRGAGRAAGARGRGQRGGRPRRGGGW